MKPLHQALGKESVIQRFITETGLSIDWLLSEVRVEVPSTDDAERSGNTDCWAIFWPSIDLDPKHIPLLREAALLAWFYSDASNDCSEEQRNAVARAVHKAALGIEFETAQAFRRAQSEKGRKRWISASEARNVADSGTEQLARKRDELGDPLPPAELWSELFSWLDDAGLDPRETGTGLDAQISFGENERKTYQAFRAQIQRHRRPS